MKLIFGSLCVGAVVFMLRFLAALLKEGKSWRGKGKNSFSKVDQLNNVESE